MRKVNVVIVFSLLVNLFFGCDLMPEAVHTSPVVQSEASFSESQKSSTTNGSKMVIVHPDGHLGDGITVEKGSVFWDADNDKQDRGLWTIYRSIHKLDPLPDDVLEKITQVQTGTHYEDVSNYFVNWLSENADMSYEGVGMALAAKGIWSFIKTLKDDSIMYRYISISQQQRSPHYPSHSLFHGTYAYLQVTDGTDNRIYILYEDASFWVGDVVLSVSDTPHILLIGDWAAYKACPLVLLGFSLSDTDVVVQVPISNMQFTIYGNPDMLSEFSDAFLLRCHVVEEATGAYVIWQNHTWEIKDQSIFVYNDLGEAVLSVSAS